MLLFRLLKKEENGKPKIGESSTTLGARQGKDIPVIDDYVYPNTGGMSVSREDFRGIPPTRLEEYYAGKSKEFMFQIKENALPESLKTRFLGDKENHYAIEPTTECFFAKYQDDLHGTRDKWTIYP